MGTEYKNIMKLDIGTEEAARIQSELSSKVIREDRLPERIGLVCGIDVGFEEENTIARAAVAVLSFPELRLVEYAIHRTKVKFPYIPGFLSFREVPAIIPALEKISGMPDLILCDGQGIAHPRRFGIACHIGILTGIPAIGVGKSLLVGTFRPPGRGRGSWTRLYDKGETVGAVLRTRDGVRPLFVSVGHKVSLGTAVEMVLRTSGGFRLPEPSRVAHELASRRKF